MSTSLTTHNSAGALVSTSQSQPSFDGLVSMGEALRRTGFLPSHIKDGVSFAAIVLMGQELGMGTMAACRKLQVIKGTVTERADSQLARFKSCGGRAQFKELTETKAVLVLRHPNGDEHTETFTIDDAKRAGLASNDNYAKHPKAMLRSRAITAGLKSIGWEGAVGIYDPDEITDVTESPRQPVEVRPKFDNEPKPAGGVIKLKTSAPEPQEFSAVEKARLAVSRAQTLERCDALRKTASERLADGTFTQAEHDEIVGLLVTKAEMLIGSEVPA